ncbi:MAG: sel1 repeat family protein [Verrucomicrobia bacterium]|nr:sel1 repeat family protein [Verrucomicrobiota bacterium]
MTSPVGSFTAIPVTADKPHEERGASHGELESRVGEVYRDTVGSEPTTPRSLCALAARYETGEDDVTKDIARARALLEKAVVLGDAEGAFMLSRILGNGGEVDKKRAGELLKSAAEKGYPPAQCAFGYHLGKISSFGIEHDPVEAARMINLAIAQGYAPAKAVLAMLHWEW